MATNFKTVDDLIEHLKSTKPYGRTETYKLWEALKRLSDGLIKIDKYIQDNLVKNIVEFPIGNIDSSNTIFMLSFDPVDNFIVGFLNGTLLERDTDYTVRSRTITIVTPPAPGDSLQFLYSVRR